MLMQAEKEINFNVEIRFEIECDIKPCPRPRVGRFSNGNAWLPKHGEKELEMEIMLRICENERLPRGLKYNAIIVIFRSGRGDIDNRLKTLMDALASVTGQNDCKITFVQATVMRNIPKNIVILGNRG